MMKEELEVWKDIPGYEGLYQISSLGRVKSLNYRGSGYENVMVGGINGRGYRHVILTCNGKRKTKKIHQLVAIVFLNHKPCGMGLVIDHINDNKLDNRLSNLQIVTHRFKTCKTQGRYSSKFKGVNYNKRMGKFQAAIRINGKIKFLGTFTNEKEASEYYENAVKAIEKGDEIVIKKANFSSKYKGVVWCKKMKKWYSKITINGKRKWLGYFKCELAASYAYQKALKELL